MPATYEPIATTTLGSAAANITFSSITSAYTDLRIVLVGTVSTVNNPRIQFNSDTASNYSYTYINGNGASATSSRGSNTVALISVGNMDTTVPTMITIDVFSYAGSTNKTLLSSYSLDKNTTDGSGNVGRVVALWRNTAAITSVTLAGGGVDFKIGTTATLYGILKA